MKKIVIFLPLAFTLMAAVSCRDRLSVIDPVSEDTFVPYSFEASIPDTKAVLNGLEVLWQEGDKIAVYDNKHNRTEFTLTSGAGTKTARFEGEIAAGFTGFYAVYPASAAGAKGAYTVPVTQNVAEDQTADPAALIMTAGSSGAVLSNKLTSISFQNACGVARLVVPAGVSEINFSGKGAFYTVNLASFVSAGNVDVVLAPGKYEDIMVGLTTGEGSFVKASENPAYIVADKILKFGNVKGAPATIITTGAQLKSYLESAEKVNTYVLKDLDLTGIELVDTATNNAVFDGRGLSIKNAALKAPLFKVNNGTVRNVVIDKSCSIASATNTYAFIAQTSNGTIENCVNKAPITVETEKTDALLIGSLAVISNGEILNCTNEGNIKVTTKADVRIACPIVGGIAALTAGQNTNVVNKGSITVDIYGSASCKATEIYNIVGATIMPSCGGIAGYSFYGKEHEAVGFDNCVNSGEISWANSGKASGYLFVRTYVAGICGTAIGGHFDECLNKAPVKAVFNVYGEATKNGKQIWVGGIFNVNVNENKLENHGFPTARGSVNEGAITLITDFDDSNNYAGGICGASDIETDGATKPEIYGCVNKGEVKADGYGYCRVAGISAGAATLTKCVNNGNVSGGKSLKAGSCIGGIVGYPNGPHDVIDCENYGNVSCSEGTNAVNVGGLFGQIGGTTGGTVFVGSKVSCNVVGSANCNVGVFAGNFSDKAYTFGTAEKPNQASGTVQKGADKVDIDDSNLDQYSAGNKSSIAGLSNPDINVSSYVMPTSIEYKGETYKIVRLKDGNWWMAENLRYVPEGMTPAKELSNVTAGVYYPLVVNAANTGAEFSTDPAVIKSNGYLYQSEVALGLKVGDIKSEVDAIVLEGCQGICPDGWHIPTIDEIIGIVGKAVSPVEPNQKAPYYNGSNGSIALLNADGFNVSAYGFITIQDYTKTSASLSGFLKTYPDRLTSSYICGSSFATIDYMTKYDPSTGIKNIQFWGFMPMTNKDDVKDYTINGSKLSARIAASVRCVKDRY